MWMSMLSGLLGSPQAMTTLPQAAPALRSVRLVFGLALLAAVPALWLRWSEPHLSHGVEALLFGLAIVGAAFILSWAAEVAQLDIAAGLALALLALIAVLPEYAVDFVFAWKGGQSVRPTGRRAGARGRPAVAVLAGAGQHDRRQPAADRPGVDAWWCSSPGTAVAGAGERAAAVAGIRLERSHSVELAFLAAATLYSLTLPLKQTITLFDAVVLIPLFVAYMCRLAKAPAEEPHLVGPARWIGGVRRRAPAR